MKPQRRSRRASNDPQAADSEPSVPQYFISHAYSDADTRAELLRCLPPDAVAHVFSPIAVRPDEMVSTSLIDAILACDGLIYLDGGQSARSFWVAFERDFAARAGKPVFRFQRSAEGIARVRIEPMRLPVFPAYCSRDYAAVAELLEIMRRQRHFDLFIPQRDGANDEQWAAVSELQLYSRLTQGGYAVIFWSERAAESKRIARLAERAYRFLPADDPTEQKILFALLDSTPLPDWYTRHLSAPGAADVTPIRPVQLFADESFSVLNRLDDLIVRLYWLVWRKVYSI